MIKDKINENSLNFLYSIMEVVHIPINFQLRGVGIDKITLSKYYFIIEFEHGSYIFINNYKNYDHIYGVTLYQLDHVFFISDENKAEILGFLADKSRMIKKFIKNFRSWNS